MQQVSHSILDIVSLWITTFHDSCNLFLSLFCGFSLRRLSFLLTASWITYKWDFRLQRFLCPRRRLVFDFRDTTNGGVFVFRFIDWSHFTFKLVIVATDIKPVASDVLNNFILFYHVWLNKDIFTIRVSRSLKPLALWQFRLEYRPLGLLRGPDTVVINAR